MKSWKNFERTTAKMLSEGLGGNWMRVPSSGAYVGGKNAARMETMSQGQIKSFSGDIIPPDEWSFIEIECKTRQDLSFNMIMKGASKDLDSWLTQTYQHNPNVGFLIFKYKASPTFVAYKHKLTPAQSFINYYSKALDTNFTMHEITVEWLASVVEEIKTLNSSLAPEAIAECI